MKIIRSALSLPAASRRSPRLSSAGLFLALLLLEPVSSFAQTCEQPGVAVDNIGSLSSAQDTGARHLFETTSNGWAFELDALRQQLGVEGRHDILAKMNDFGWRGMGDNHDMGSWLGAWQDMAKQLSSATLFQTGERHAVGGSYSEGGIGAYTDAKNTLKAALEEQKQRVKSKLQNQPTDDGCRFDTMASSLALSRQTSDAIANGYEWDVMKEGNNEYGSFGMYGPAHLENYLWQAYHSFYCDYEAEGGKENSGCKNDPGDPLFKIREKYKNNDVLPSKMLFAKETIDLKDFYERTAVMQMIYNLSGYKVATPIMKGSLDSPQGMGQVLNRRTYLAQMDAVNALLYGVLGDRAPGPPAPDVQNMRAYEGVTTASATPSSHEIRQAILNQLWDPHFYSNLYDSPNTIGQKEVYLRAYNLMLLYDLIAKQEKISNVYAIQTSNLMTFFNQTEATPTLGETVR